MYLASLTVVAVAVLWWAFGLPLPGATTSRAIPGGCEHGFPPLSNCSAHTTVAGLGGSLIGASFELPGSGWDRVKDLPDGQAEFTRGSRQRKVIVLVGALRVSLPAGTYSLDTVAEWRLSEVQQNWQAKFSDQLGRSSFQRGSRLVNGIPMPSLSYQRAANGLRSKGDTSIIDLGFDPSGHYPAAGRRGATFFEDGELVIYFPTAAQDEPRLFEIAWFDHRAQGLDPWPAADFDSILRSFAVHRA